MNISLKQSNQLKSIAILMMVCIHLFNTIEYEGLFQPIIYWGDLPIIYYISLFCDAAVPIFSFVAGYGIYLKYKQNPQQYGLNTNLRRIKLLYKNYWVIFILFVIILGGLLKGEAYLGSVPELLLAFSGITASSYNGAAWFFTIYIIFLLLSKPIFKIVDLFPKITFILSGILYVIGYYFRMYHYDLFSNNVINWIYFNTCLFFATLFQILMGVYVIKFNWKAHCSTLFNVLSQKISKNIIAVLGMIGLVCLHAYIPNAILAPITGLGFVLLFVQMDIPKVIDKVLEQLNPHATNIWLTHMFFYITFFKEFIYSPKYIIPILLLLLACTILSSYLINFILGLKLPFSMKLPLMDKVNR